MPKACRPGQGATETTGNRWTAPLKGLRLTVCPCGHLNDAECARHRPIPALKGCGGCTSLGAEGRAFCARMGYYCTETSCARSLMPGGAA
jgi:hypothetical protein